MELIVPDILADVRELSTSLSVMAILVGCVLWLAGWWSHGFWVVMGFTVLGGIWGLQNAVALRTQPLLAAIGVGLAAGVLALTVARLGAFVAGGYAGLMLMHAALPSLEQPLLGFLAGAFIGFLWFRYCMMAFTSLAGVVLVVHAALALIDKLGKFDAVNWSANNPGVLNWVCAFLAVVGFGVQLFVGWWRGRKASAGGDKEKKEDDKGSKKPKSDGVLAASLAAFRRAG
jgi:hypothetical protein